MNFHSTKSINYNTNNAGISNDNNNLVVEVFEGRDAGFCCILTSAASTFGLDKQLYHPE